VDQAQIDRLVRIDPALAKAALARESKVARAHASGMLGRRDGDGNPLYRVTQGGNIVRTKPITARLKRRIHTRDGFHCVECGSENSLEVAHIEPYRVTGNNSDDNLRTLCADCHAREGD
jgi:hypothetical protein